MKTSAVQGPGPLDAAPLDPARRRFLGRITGAVAGACLAHDSASAFEGAHAGAERSVDGLRLCWCPAGRFVMGSPPGEPGHRPDEAQVPVTLTRGFWIAKFEVMQREWRQLMGGVPSIAPSEQFGAGDRYPVYWVTFPEAEAFCARRTDLARRSGDLPASWEFRLPTEAQWEYACRAGTATATAFGDGLTLDQANVKALPSNSSDRRRPVGRATEVGRYPANAWGVCDMHGNVFEWCRDWYHPRLPGGTDPDLYDLRGAPNRDGTYSRVRRGGAWNDEPLLCRSAFRLRYEPHRSSDHIGFRVVVVAGTSA